MPRTENDLLLLDGITVGTYAPDGYAWWAIDSGDGAFFSDITERGPADHSKEILTWLFEHLDELYKVHIDSSREEEIRKSEKELFETLAVLIGRNIIYRTINLTETHQRTRKRYYLGVARVSSSALESAKIKENNVLIYFDSVDEAKIKIPRLIADENTDWRIIALPDGMEYEV